MSRRKAGGQASILLGSQLVFNSLICSMVQVISPGARPLLALKDLSVISTSAAFRLRKILNNDLPTSRHVHAPSDRSIESTGVPSYLISSKNRRDLSSRPCVISRLKSWLFATELKRCTNMLVGHARNHKSSPKKLRGYYQRTLLNRDQLPSRTAHVGVRLSGELKFRDNAANIGCNLSWLRNY